MNSIKVLSCTNTSLIAHKLLQLEQCVGLIGKNAQRDIQQDSKQPGRSIILLNIVIVPLDSGSKASVECVSQSDLMILMLNEALCVCHLTEKEFP